MPFTHCLIIINGLQSTHDWDSIKAALLSDPPKGCILVITNEASVATHCAEAEEGVLNMEDMEADPMLRPMFKVCMHYFIVTNQIKLKPYALLLVTSN